MDFDFLDEESKKRKHPMSQKHGLELVFSIISLGYVWFAGTTLQGNQGGIYIGLVMYYKRLKIKVFNRE